MEYNHSAKNITVMITRPPPAGTRLCKKIQSLGYNTLYYPTIEIRPPLDLHTFHEEIKKIHLADWIVFISPQAVINSIDPIKAQNWDFPGKTKIAAIGLGTAEQLQAMGIAVDCYPKNNQNSEGLLDLSEFQEIEGLKIILVRGEDGRTVLADALTTRGACVSHLIAYRRCPPQQPVSSDIIQLFRENKIHIIICASGEAIKNLAEKLKEVWQPYLQQVPLIVISERLALLAKTQGFKHILLAENASDNAVINILKEKICQNKP